MISQIFAIIQLLLKLIGLGEWLVQKKTEVDVAKREERREDRDKAVDNQVNAKDEEEFDREQDIISRNLPR